MATPDYRSHIDMLPLHMRVPMLDYIEKGWPPGGFLAAVLCNDLKMAVSRADHININFIVAYAQYLMWYAPAACHGSHEKVVMWIERGGLEGFREKEKVNG